MSSRTDRSGRAPEPPLRLRLAAEYLGVTPRWLRRQVSERRIPFIKANHLLLFLPADLDAYLQQNRVEEVEH